MVAPERDCGVAARSLPLLDEVIEVLCAPAPDLHGTVQRAKDGGLAHLILDGKYFLVIDSTSRSTLDTPAILANRVATSCGQLRVTELQFTSEGARSPSRIRQEAPHPVLQIQR
ncbi:hypothetical protein AB0M83_40450 [Amycolatopsis sp. NPDC051106]|uniref:hypothetical protein n=1 Tax=unclassified Amycolatopsis TaxID=2618356 RepID=UPI0034469EE3